MKPGPIIVVMGVSGAGKTTLGEALARRLACPFADADEFHPPANIAKMRAGIALDDDDRQSWLEAIASRIRAWHGAGGSGIVTCSALKRGYRRMVLGDLAGVHLVYLKGDPALMMARVAGRSGHFMPASLIGSQFDTLEEPEAEERPIILAAERPITELVADVLRVVAPDVTR